MKQLTTIVCLAAFFLFACGKKDGGSASIIPTNLVFSAVVSTDNSGNVTFTASATNAVSYEFDFGNGLFQTSTTGSYTYKYPTGGTYLVNVIAKSSTGETASKSTTITVTKALALVFSDEFDVDGAPNSAKWGYDLGAGGWGNNELQNYTNRIDNSFVSGGTLKIKAIKESFSGSAYTSARLLTQNKFSFKYGKVEIKAKLPAGVGTWPAIWMLGANITTVNWPACGEIDIMEHKGSTLNKIYGTVHHPARFGGNADGATKDITNATTEFHIYTMEWDTSTIKFLVDGTVFHTVGNSSSLPFNQNFFIIMNLAMGGTFAGPVESGFTNASMEVDYIRVYQ